MTFALATMAATRTAAQTPSPIRVTPKSVRASAYLNELANPRGLAWVAGGAMLEELRYEDRTDLADELAFRATKRAVGISVRHGLAAAMHLGTDTRYHFCECSGIGPRVAHALLETFTDRRDGGGQALAVPRLAAHYAENLTALAWEHDRSSVGSVVTGTSLSFGVQALINIGRELTGISLGTAPRVIPTAASSNSVQPATVPSAEVQ
jgi:hypothetical protein